MKKRVGLLHHTFFPPSHSLRLRRQPGREGGVHRRGGVGEPSLLFLPSLNTAFSILRTAASVSEDVVVSLFPWLIYKRGSGLPPAPLTPPPPTVVPSLRLLLPFLPMFPVRGWRGLSFCLRLFGGPTRSYSIPLPTKDKRQRSNKSKMKQI